MKSKKTRASLISFTSDAMPLMCMIRRVMHSEIPDSIDDLKKEPKKWLGMEIDDYIDKVLLFDNMPTFLEYINLTFKLEGVSRALQQQLTRHRIGFSYSIQSMRCIDLPNFADNKKYYNPYVEGGDIFASYHEKMLKIQSEYRQALKEDVPIQDARGLLPLNIYSTITFSCSLRALIGMLNKRLCLKTQGEFRHVAELIMEEIKNKMDKRILKWIGPPCKVQGYCMMKGENEEQLKEKKITGKQNTDHICPLYEKFSEGKL